MTNQTAQRVADAIRAVAPPSAKVSRGVSAGPFVQVKVNGRLIRAYWLGEGWPQRVKEAVAQLGRRRPDVFVARRMSEGARAEALRAGVGWIDETGGGDLAMTGLVIARTGRSMADERPTRWTPAVMAIAEAVLIGTRPTVADTIRATGLSADTCTRALAYFASLGVLTARASRGRSSARELVDADRLLHEYATAAGVRTRTELRVGVLWSDPIKGLAELGQRWEGANKKWAATGAAAAAVLAPLLTESDTAEVFVSGETPGDLQRAADVAAVKPMEGGRLLLRPFPSSSTARLSTRIGRLWVAPWPRVYADLRGHGVRGEDAAEHLREVMNAR